MTIEELKMARVLYRKIERLQSGLADIKSTGGVGSAANDIAVMGGADCVGVGQRMVEIDEEITILQAKLNDERVIINRFIDNQNLNDLPHMILWHRYVACWDWKDISRRLGYTRQRLYQVHSEALKKIIPH